MNVSASSNFTDPSLTYRGELLDFHVTVHTDAYFQTRPDYVWTVTNAKLLKGQHTPWIQVKTTGEAGETVTATVEVEGFDLSCSKRAEHSVIIKE